MRALSISYKLSLLLHKRQLHTVNHKNMYNYYTCIRYDFKGITILFCKQIAQFDKCQFGAVGKVYIHNVIIYLTLHAYIA